MTVAEAVTLIGAITAAVVSIVTAFAQLRQGAKLDRVHTAVNGQSVRMELLASAAGRAEGLQASAEAARHEVDQPGNADPH